MPATRSSRALAADPVLDRAPARVPLAARCLRRSSSCRRRLGRCCARRVRAAVARAGIHARHHRRTRRRFRTSCSRCSDPPPRRARSRRRRRLARARAACRFALQASDPYIAGIRIGQNPATGVVRIVFDLKAETRPQLFALAARRRLRASRRARSLSADPGRSADGAARAKSGAARMAQRSRRRAPERSALANRDAEAKRSDRRKIIVALDPGHGGEDPGRDRPARHVREERRARHRAEAEDACIDAEPGMRAMLTRDDDYLRPARDAREKGAGGAGGSLRVDPCRCIPRARARAARRCSRCREQRRDQRGGEMARAEGERRGPDRRRQSRRARSGARAHADRPFADRADQRQPEGRAARCWTASARSMRCTRRRSSRPGSRC